MRGAPDRQRARGLYRDFAPTYDRNAARAEWLLRRLGMRPLRERIIARLSLQPGDVVVDVGCGTGLSFPLLEEAIGPTGQLIGVELTPEMLDRAFERTAANGWQNVTLIEASAEEAHLPLQADAILFCLGHDIMSSPEALANILGQVKGGGRVAAGGTMWAPWWAFPVNAFVWSIAHSGITTWEGFERPWRYLAPLVPDLKVESISGGGAYAAWGTLPASERVGQGSRAS